MSKYLSWLRTGVMLLATIVLISSCQQDSEPTRQTEGSLQFSFSAADINKSGRVQAGECASVLVTIADANGIVVASNKQLTLYAFNEGYLSEPIALTTGQYTLTGFVVLNDANNAVYAAPVKGSALAYLVDKPLPISFTATKDIVSNVDVQVIAVAGNSAKDFGYTTFSFNVVKTITFNMAVIAQDQSKLTDGRILITSGTQTVYDKNSVAGITTRVQVRDGYTSYAINVTKDGYKPYSQTFTAEKLKHYTTDSVLIVNLIRDNSVVNRALQFDGTNDYIELGNIYDSLAFPLTMSVWVYLPETKGYYALPIFDSQDNSPQYNGVTLAVMAEGSAIVAGYGDGRGYNSSAYRRNRSAPVSNIAGRWIHIAATMRSPYDMNVYLDGVKLSAVFDGESTQPIASNFPMDIAKIGTWSANGNTYRFRGTMDELTIWNRALSDAEIKDNMKTKFTGAENGLIGYWSFDEADGSTVRDGSGRNYNGAIKGNPKRVAGAF